MRRVLTALALVAVAIYLILWAPVPVFMAAAVLMSLICYWEYSALVLNHNIPRPDELGIAAGLIILFVPGWTLIALSTLIVVAFCRALPSENMPAILLRVACTLLGTLYAFAPWRFSRDLRDVSVHLLFFALALNWVGDSAAFYVGRQFGRHKLAPLISPSKSWEGAAASVLGSVVFGILYLGHFIPAIALWRVVLMAVVGNISGQAGDLSESAIKRGAGVKDSGHMLPGHGGMLDRVDSSLFALPVVYLLFLLTRIHV